MAGVSTEEREALGALSGLEKSVAAVEAQLEPLLRIPKEELSDELSNMESAKLNAALAYTVNSLFFMYLKTRGVETKDHAIKSEIDRVKKYFGKIKAAGEGQAGGAGVRSAKARAASSTRTPTKKRKRRR